MKVFNTEQIRAWDAYTIAHEPITSLELMNRAAHAFANWFTGIYPNSERPVIVFCGTGNNGGDGLAVARLLHRLFFGVKVFVWDFGGRRSGDFSKQLKALPEDVDITISLGFTNLDALKTLPEDAIIIDALFGSGLSRPLQGDWAEIMDFVNSLPHEVIAIDLPSGLFADAPTPPDQAVRATRTFTFQAPKRAFFFPENAGYLGEWAVGDIGLHPVFAEQTATPYYFLEKKDVQRLRRPRRKFEHKGSFGHALLVAGSYGKMGAAVLAARACLRSGVGLLTVHAPRVGNLPLQIAAPEAMYSPDAGAKIVKQAPDIQHYQAVGLGPGLGTAEETAAALEHLLRQARTPLVIDADALNLLAQHPDWWPLVPKHSILTPHPKEFERLFGSAENDFARHDLQRAKAQEHGLIILLKGAYSAIALPDGSCYFNSTGNPGMATGGSGDVLTGMLTGLLGQGYPPEEAALLGVYWHGLAGDLAAQVYSQSALLAGDLVEWLGEAMKVIEE